MSEVTQQSSADYWTLDCGEPAGVMPYFFEAYGRWLEYRKYYGKRHRRRWRHKRTNYENWIWSPHNHNTDGIKACS